MRRLRVRLVLPGDYAGGRTAAIEAAADAEGTAARMFDVPRRIGKAVARWGEDGFLVGPWCGCVPSQGWLQQEWFCAGHVRPGWCMEAVSWPMAFGRVYLRGVAIGVTGTQTVVAEQEAVVNESPAAVRRLRLMGQDAQGRIGVVVA